MRIVSLVPNATEILFAVGAGPEVVGVSHECDFPEEARRLPVLTGSALRPGLTAAEVDAAVSGQLATGASLYTLDEERIAALEPDLVATQTLCPVCAVSTAQVDAAIAPLPRCPELLTLDPKTLDDVLADVVATGRATGREERAREVAAGLRARLEAVRERAGRRPARPRVLALEWLDPPFLAGHWVPEMIAAAGGEDAAGTAPGAPSRRTSWDEIARLDPDVVLVVPCGFDAAGAAAEAEKLSELPAASTWRALRAVRAGRVHPLDANARYSRPGPRLVDGVEELAEILAGA